MRGVTPRTLTRALPIVIIVVGILAAIGGNVAVHKRCTELTIGQVVSYRRQRVRRHYDYIPTICYQVGDYIYTGEPQTGGIVSGTPVGSDVEIYYNPIDPNEYCLAVDTAVPAILVVSSIAGIILLVRFIRRSTS